MSHILLSSCSCVSYMDHFHHEEPNRANETQTGAHQSDSTSEGAPPRGGAEEIEPSRLSFKILPVVGTSDVSRRACEGHFQVAARCHGLFGVLGIFAAPPKPPPESE